MVWHGCDDGRCNDLDVSTSLLGVSDVHASMRVDTHVCLVCALIYPQCLMIMRVLFSPFQGRTAKSLSLGGRHTCAILDNDTVKCWGRNNEGQLGLDDTNHRGDGPNEMGNSLTAVDLGTVSGAAAPW